MSPPLLKIKELSKSFQGLRALHDNCLCVEPNEILGVIGPNGSGKSTLFNLITGIIRPSSGSIHFSSARIDGFSPANIARLGIARTFQGTRLFRSLSVIENIRTAVQLRYPINLFEAITGLGRAGEQVRKVNSQAENLLDLVGLSNRADMLAGSLPYGDQRLLEIARALGTKPKILMMDEPAAGLDSQETASLLKLIKRIRDEFDLAVMVIEHDMDLIMNLCERIMVLAQGETICEGSPSEVQADHRVRTAYLGSDDLTVEPGGAHG